MRYVRGLFLLCGLLVCASPCFGQIVNVHSLSEQKKQGLMLLASGTADWRVGNVNFTLVEGSLIARLAYTRHMFLLSGQGGLGIKSDERFVARAFSHVRYRYMFLKWLGAETFGQLEYNEFWRMAARRLAGLGAVFRVRPLKQLSVMFGTAYMFEYNQYSDSFQYPGGGNEKIFHRWSNYIRLKFQLDKILSFQHTTFFQPSFEDFADWRLLVDTSLSIKLKKWLAITISHVLSYNSIPPVGGATTVSPLDSSLLVGLTSTFHLWKPKK